MPLIDELPVTLSSHYFAADYLASRSPGPHMKAIIDDYIEHHALGSGRKSNPEFADALDDFAVMGFAWERAATAAIEAGAGIDLSEESATPLVVRRIYEHAFTRALNEGWQASHSEVVKPGEVTVDGIHCTPDGANTRLRATEEWKCSWASARHSLDEAHPDWMMQIPGYCRALGLNVGILRVFHVNGYYENSRMGKPVARFYRLRWSDEELEENWEQIRAHRDVMAREGRLL